MSRSIKFDNVSVIVEDRSFKFHNLLAKVSFAKKELRLLKNQINILNNNLEEYISEKENCRFQLNILYDNVDSLKSQALVVSIKGFKDLKDTINLLEEDFKKIENAILSTKNSIQSISKSLELTQKELDSFKQELDKYGKNNILYFRNNEE